MGGSGSGAISRFGRYNPLFYRAGGARGSGGFIGYQFSSRFRVDGGYLAIGASFDPNSGLFGSNYTGFLLMSINPISNLEIGVGGAYAYNDASGGGINLAGGTGTDFAGNPFLTLPVFGSGQGERVHFPTANFMFRWRVLPKFTLAGWFGYGWARGESDRPPAGGMFQGTRQSNILTGALQFLFPEPLNRKGDMGGLIIGVPPYVTANQWSGFPIPGGTTSGSQGSRKLNYRDTSLPLHLELFYRFQVTEKRRKALHFRAGM